MQWDVMIVGAGPAGSVCAANCARSGLKTLLLDRSSFPRDKVCGDCLNPSVWEVFERLDWAPNIRKLPSCVPTAMDYVGISGRRVTIPLPETKFPETVIRRHDLDASLVQCAQYYGAVFQENHAVQKVSAGWKVETPAGAEEARVLVAADGRNSTVCRILGLMPKSRTDRVALQAHIPRPAHLKRRLQMMLFPAGYGGLVDLDENSANLCVVSSPRRIDETCNHALKTLGISENPVWKSIAPISRPPLRSNQPRLFVIGDAARVVEPFTGEGIHYAMRSGELAAREIAQAFKSDNWENAARRFQNDNAAMYSRTLWINRLARFLCERPAFGSFLLDRLPFRHRLLTALTAKVCEKRTYT